MRPLTIGQAEELCRMHGPVPPDKTWAQHLGDTFRTRLPSEADPDEVAHAAIYLSIGFEDAHRADDIGERYQAWTGGMGGGHLECMNRLVELARIQEQWLLDEGKDEFPGVFSYEFTEPLGSWLYANGDPTDDEFKTELARRWDEWLKRSET